LTDEPKGVEPPEPSEREPESRRTREDPEAKKERLAEEARRLEASVAAGSIADLKSKVAGVLNLYPHTRNSDVALMLKYWEIFQPELFKPNVRIDPELLFSLERLTSIARVRATIQNDYRLFPADAQIRKYRRSKQEDVKEEVVEEKPARRVVQVFADETGKTGRTVCVAAVWALTGEAVYRAGVAIRAWQSHSEWDGKELHFADLKKHHRNSLGEYLRLIESKREFLSFKAISFDQQHSRRKVEEIVHRLHERMVVEGARHEIRNNRIRLPQDLSLIVDEDQSLDKLACTDIKERIDRSLRYNYGDELLITSVKSAKSQFSELIQLADLIAGALNRKLNTSGSVSHKDEMAEMILSTLAIGLEPDSDEELDAAVMLSV
jgi:hypothetical protein